MVVDGEPRGLIGVAAAVGRLSAAAIVVVADIVARVWMNRSDGAAKRRTHTTRV